MKTEAPPFDSRSAVEKRDAAPPVRTLDRSSVEPLYRQLANTLLHMIDTGELAAAQRLPSETALMASYGVSRITVRQANELLVQHGKVTAHRGKGTFVAGRVLRHDLDALQGFYAALRS